MSKYRFLRLLIRGSGMTQTEVAEKAGITEKHLSRLCTGQTGISVETSQKIAEVLDLPEELLYVGLYLENLEIERAAAENPPPD
jgi:transcriptional regulator with XRE-family HTH domain